MTDLATTGPADADTHEQAIVPDPSAPRTERVPAVLPDRRPRRRPDPQCQAAGSSLVLTTTVALLATALVGGLWLASRTDPERRLVSDPPVTATVPARESPLAPTTSLTQAPATSLCLRHCDTAPSTATTSAHVAPTTTASPQATAPTTATTAPGTDPPTDGPSHLPVDQSPATTAEPSVVVTLPSLPPLEPFDPDEPSEPPAEEPPVTEPPTTEGTTSPVDSTTPEEGTIDG